MATTTFYCEVCNRTITHTSDITTGYGVNSKGQKVCFECCGKEDVRQMRQTGKATLYFEERKGAYSTVQNWPGTMVIPVGHWKKGRHNWAGVRYDFWFTFEGEYWHGYTVGDNTQIAHCRRSKKPVYRTGRDRWTMA